MTLRRKKQAASLNLGTARAPIDFGQGRFAYKRNGQWRYRNPETRQRWGRRFVGVTDGELVRELERRGYQILYPAHECVDRPNLPCPACEMGGARGAQSE
jgi:hypothetical protein